VNQKYAVWGFAGAAFLITLGITSWRNGLWSSDEPSAQPGGAAASHSIAKPNPIPKDPFHAAMIRPAASPEAQQTTQSPPQPTVGNAPSPTQEGPPPAPDPIYEESQSDYKQRAKLMEEIAARARAK
jgi:hypothetical protein